MRESPFFFTLIQDSGLERITAKSQVLHCIVEMEKNLYYKAQRVSITWKTNL